MIANKKQREYLLGRLTDEDHRVNAALQLGGVTKVLVERRGTLTESFLCAGVDVTQSITKLERAGLVDTHALKWNIDEEVRELVVNKYRNSKNFRSKP